MKQEKKESGFNEGLSSIERAGATLAVAALAASVVIPAAIGLAIDGGSLYFGSKALKKR
jgi:hypothetical protein